MSQNLCARNVHAHSVNIDVINNECDVMNREYGNAAQWWALKIAMAIPILEIVDCMSQNLCARAIFMAAS